ncbi:MAG: hypothetical protein ACK56F_21135, partial [bacterium]
NLPCFVLLYSDLSKNPKLVKDGSVLCASESVPDLDLTDSATLVLPAEVSVLPNELAEAVLIEDEINEFSCSQAVVSRHICKKYIFCQC